MRTGDASPSLFKAEETFARSSLTSSSSPAGESIPSSQSFPLTPDG